MPADASKNFLKEYKYWTVSLHGIQDYLGRSVIWCKREDATDLVDATKEEQEELFKILHEARQAVTNVFKPDWFNYSFLGNAVPHLHGHLVPRYSEPRQFMGVTFKDERWGKNWLLDPNFVVPEAVMDEIRSLLKNELAK